LPRRTTADGWVRAIPATIPALMRAVRPTLLLTQHGADTHRLDPIADLSVTLEAQREALMLLRERADGVCEGRWLAVRGDGRALGPALAGPPAVRALEPRPAPGRSRAPAPSSPAPRAPPPTPGAGPPPPPPPGACGPAPPPSRPRLRWPHPTRPQIVLLSRLL